MARPIKEGLDYFPLDVDIDQDDKIAIIEALHGVEGFGIVIKLLMKIYKEGYFYEWTKREQILFSKRVNVDINKVTEVINDCINEGLFNKNLFEGHNILTSKGIQKRYLEAIKRRKEVSFIEKFYLIDDVNSIIGTSNIAIFLVNDDGNRVNVNINSNNANISTQRKEKKIKENKRIKDIVAKFTISDMENAQLLFELMRQNNPSAKAPNFDKWADEFRLIRERDERSDEAIKYLINWSQKDSFWKTNILSPAKLRKQWDQLVLKAKEEHSKKTQQPQKQLTRLQEMHDLALELDEGGKTKSIGFTNGNRNVL